MKFLELLKGVEVEKTIGQTDVEIQNVQINSNAVNSGSLFICLSGGDYDGCDFVEEAKNYGAVAIVSEREIETSLPLAIVKDARLAMSKIASNFYLNVSEKMRIIGVVGTNGKTTTSHMIAKILNDAGIKCGVIGTLGVQFGETYYQPTLTTPDPLELHKIFAKMYSEGYNTVVMEVSAHAIYHKKINGLKFDVGVLTNFSRDHLDFFNDMERYREVKKSFFVNNFCDYIVVNADDSLGVEILTENEKAMSYGIENPADVFAIDLEENESGSKFIINLFDCVFKTKINLIGAFNVYNALSASTVCALLGVRPKKIVESLNKLQPISGRLECVYDNIFRVYIDYAHTPDGLKKVILALKNNTKNRLICVFGCGGNRDEGKRILMGELSGELADFTVITSDNPRFEEPMEIIYEIEKGVLEKTKNYVIIQDRVQAIEYALKLANSGDAILIAGKGSENYQEVLGIKRPYNDKDTVEEIIRRNKF